jgi:hypothetical protein
MSLSFFLFWSLTGCAKMALNMAGPPMVNSVSKRLFDTGSARLVKEGISGDLLLITALVEMSPDNPKLLSQCAFFYAANGLFVEDEDPRFASELYKIGKEYGLRALKTNKKFRKGIESGQKFSDLVKNLDDRYIEAITWTAANMGLYMFLNMEDWNAFLDLVDMLALVNRSIELDGNYFYGFGKLYTGIIYSFLPPLLCSECGEKPAQKMFKEARQVTDGKLLLVDFYEARFLSTLKKDEKQFEALMKRVMEGDSQALKGGRLLNELAKLKAEYALNHIKKYF